MENTLSRWFKAARPIVPAMTALLSSSCCIIQLALNFFSFSCAGFAVLTPFRPILTAITIILLTYSFYARGWKDKKMAGTTLVSIVLLVSPEIVEWINQNQTQSQFLAVTTTYLVQLQGLGCIACANRIKSALLAVDVIESATVFFDNSSAVVRASQANVAHIVLDTIKGIDLKYDANILESW
ncbi:hypothetical protein PHYBLDRAFT_147124 [Phycomyces blakesleeanus NRRL 1555(-)]|uniref:HMA domain-containing protein n=2 Tax=Phycomyces blakesleeanus TaxID=4837 RepID=A0A163DLK4_PHYB8|nr:hypothetical protein PHYBLDRAFT_147124 [Phycomyces blakesleeanus NRRL 1555(-)]OAD72150.1 hypothetical protein PHYBLDRAFT_147124 [Phycomyces blakesleeanus NRRL 1555(-)]|eukprot:XP_018290190.1 hypothetical protein PHYBLDRAFT_147124 [Phycomyces blakesleeanus NRRL 1555(-)]